MSAGGDVSMWVPALTAHEEDVFREKAPLHCKSQPFKITLRTANEYFTVIVSCSHCTCMRGEKPSRLLQLPRHIWDITHSLIQAGCS